VILLPKSNAILSSEVAKVKFANRVGNYGIDESDRTSLMEYVLERYANMRGTYFVRRLKGNSRNQVQKMSDSQATRTRVSNTIVCAKRIADNNAVSPLNVDNDKDDNDSGVVDDDNDDDDDDDEEFWDSAKDSVFELAETDEHENSIENEYISIYCCFSYQMESQWRYCQLVHTQMHCSCLPFCRRCQIPLLLSCYDYHRSFASHCKMILHGISVH
jgi:hypothetical protein